MKPSDTGVLLLSHGALIAGVLAEALPPQGIPIQCATICGPMVELSAICSGGRGRGREIVLAGKRRDVAPEKRPVAAHRKETAARQPNDGPDIAERAFTIIVPAPTSFPSSLLVQEGTLDPPKESKTTHIRPTQIFPTLVTPLLPSPPSTSSLLPPPPPAAITALPGTPTDPSNDDSTISPPTTEPTEEAAGPTTSRGPHSSMDATTEGDDGGDGDGEPATPNNSTQPDKDQGRWTMNTGEEDCVCLNKSFNVPEVAALCASCIAGADQEQNDMSVIMTTCKFASAQYSPDKDKVAENIHVQATPPQAVLGQNAGVTSAGALMLTPIQGAQIAVGAAWGLLQLWFL
ncbi:hypothetical protein CCM_01684 [Cordyceps militaris CM01]|uniref:Uncharacterized protein n=1 Tax=Cordyceps militaris (strain CM01) TaxID=983644 RepID=G3J6J7_CORMM|nr:uncharacterized protein CCM_01684 [Cordyceps militaris CM01]EGX97025.1 hypothetical protein CCM_01684 [Cordyceps militaris CM01]